MPIFRRAGGRTGSWGLNLGAGLTIAGNATQTITVSEEPNPINIYRGVILNKFFKVIDGTHHRGGPCDHLVTSYLIIV